MGWDGDGVGWAETATARSGLGDERDKSLRDKRDESLRELRVGEIE